MALLGTRRHRPQRPFPGSPINRSLPARRVPARGKLRAQPIVIRNAPEAFKSEAQADRQQSAGDSDGYHRPDHPGQNAWLERAHQHDQ